MKSKVWRTALRALLLCVCFTSAAQAQDKIWRIQVQGATGETTNARHTALLTNGDLIVGGFVGSTSASRDFLVYRINGTNGNIVWTRRIDGGGTGESIVEVMADPATGDTWFCGTSSLTGQGLNWKVMKLNGSDGSNGWASGFYTYNGPASSNDAPRMCKLIQDGATKNIIVAGQASTSLGNGARVVKINAATGAQMWEFNNFSVFQEYVTLAVNDATGDIYAAGSSQNPSTFVPVAMVTRLNLAGTAAWTVSANARANESIVNITNGAIDAATGDFIGSGFTNVSNDNDIWITRFAKNNGAKTWQTLINGPGNAIDGGQAIALDATHIYIGTGQYSTVGGGTDFFFARLNLTNGLYDAANGGWTVSFGGDDTASQESLANMKLVGTTLYAAGSTRYLAVPGRVLTTVKLNATSGAIVNRTNFTERVGPQIVGFNAMQVASNGDMLIAGDANETGFTGYAEIGRYGGASTANDANLSNLTTTAGALTPTFDPSLGTYAASVGNGTTSITVTPTTAQPTATVKVNGVTVASGTASGAINLAVGLNDITIVVTATDGTTTKTYNLTVTRAVCPTCPPPWVSVEAFGNTSTPNASMARSVSDVVYGLRIKDGGANATVRLIRYDNPGPSGTWTTVGEFARSAVVPAVDTIDGDPSLAIDRNGRFHIALTARVGTSDGVYYGTSATGANGTWTFTQVATISGINTDMQDAVIKTDPTNNLPRIVYISSDANAVPRTYNLYIAQLAGSTWTSTLLLGQTGSNEIRVPDIDIDSTGRIHVAFAAETNGGGTDGSLMYVNNTTGSFPAPTNLVAGSTGNDQARSLSILLDTSDRVHIVRQNQANQLFETTNVSGSFASTQLNGSLTGSVRPDSLSRNDFNDIYLEYRNTGTELRYAYLPTGTGSTWLTGLLYRGNTNTATRHAGVVTNSRFGFALFDHRPAGPSGNQELWAAIQLLPAPEIVVEQPAGTDIADGGSKGYGNVNVGSNSSLTFSVRNIGAAPMTLGTITIDGTNASDFTVTTAPTSPVAAGGTTTFVLRFAPGAVGARSAAIHIPNNDANESPFDITVTGTGVNTPPVITPASALTRQRGSSATAAAVATVSDAETAAGSLVVTAPTVPAGLTVGSLTNAAGNVTAVVTASCTATIGANTVVLRVADVANATTDGNLTVNVTANTAPTFAYANQAALPGGSLTVNPSTALTDNGTIASVVVQNAGTYTGTISVNASGVVSLSNIAPSGTHTITIRATDNCGTSTDASFTLNVNAPPVVTPATGITRQRGTSASTATVGTVSDTETSANSLAVSYQVPVGLTVGTVTNSNGTVAVPLAASCSATLGNNTTTLSATDAAGVTTSASVIVAVTANTAPTLAYANQIVAPAGTLTINPSTALGDNGTSTVAIQSQGTYTGTISVDASGVVSVANAAPAGAHTITIRATDNCGTFTDASFELLVNTPPTITPGSPSARQGSPAALTTIATVADGESPAASISVNTPTLSPGLSLTGLANNAGTVQGNLAASCSAAVGANSISLFAGDGRQGTTVSIPVDVLANTAPAFAYTAQAAVAGGSLTINPDTPLTDNGTIATVVVQSQGTYTGTISVNASGVVAIANAAPSGTHTITIRATDDCGAATNATFQLSVNARPTVTPAVGLARQQGTAATGATLGTVSDLETSAGSLLVATTPPAGIVVGTLANTTGTVTAPLAASCSATLGNNTVVLSATDAAGNTGTGNVVVAVTANTAPTLAYGAQIVAPGASLAVTPSTALGDNGTATVAVQDVGTYTGTISVDAAGVVSVSNAAPAGAHIITIRATDNCGTTTDASFELLVNTPPTITPGTPSARQGSPAAPTTIATVADGESPAGSISVNTPTLSPGLSFTGLANNAGNVQGNLAASCSATVGANSITLFAGDGRQGTTATIPVDVLANTPPALAYATQGVPTGGSLTINPTATIGDNGSVVSVALLAQGTYTGTISVLPSGVVSVSNAAPSGSHTITIRTTDNCGAQTDATFTLVVNALPTVTVATGLVRQRGTPESLATLGTVADLETAASGIAVTATPPAGIVLGSLANANGTVTAPLSASCTAALGDNTVVLTATDTAGSSTNGNVIVAVTDNTAPTLAYADRIVAPGAATTVNPSTALSDNGTATVAVQGLDGYTGTISVDASGVVTIANAAPAGAHVITIRATDNCGATRDASFELLVNTPPTITAGSPSVRQGSPAAITTLASVADGESNAGTLTVSTTSVASGLTLTDLANASGVVQASVAASCTAAVGALPVGLSVSDGRQGASLTVNVDVQANSPPTVSYAAQTLPLNGSALVVPTAAPGDNGSVTGIALQSAGTYTGVVSVDTQGRITFANAAPVGTHTLQVRLTDNCGLTTDQAVTLTIARASPSLQLSTNVSPSRFGQPVVLTADVSGAAPTGSIEFLADDVTLGSATLTGSGDNRSATLTTSALAVGNPVLKVRYAGDTNNAPVESTLGTQLVQAAATRITLAPDANPGAPGNRTIALQVLPNAPGGGTPAGSVNLVSGAASCVATLNAGAGSCALNLATVGYKTITATYTPTNENHTASTASTSIVIGDGSTSGDVRVRIGNGREFITPGSALQYQVTIDNVGPNAMVARVQVPMAAQLANPSFQCLRAGPAQCGTLSGSGNIDTEVQLGPGGIVIYTINATAPIAPESTITMTATATVIAPGTDPLPANNTATDADPMGLFLDGFEDVSPDEEIDE